MTFLPLASIPYLKQNSHLPVIADPSHGTGKRSLVEPMCKAAVAAGADGLVLEVHTRPELSVVDAPQTVSCEEFAEIVRTTRAVALAIGRDM